MAIPPNEWNHQRFLPAGALTRLFFRPSWILALVLAGILVTPEPTSAAGENEVKDVAETVSAYRQAHEREILEEFFALLRLPNYAPNRDDIMANAEHIAGMLERRDIQTHILESGDAAPAVYGELNTPGAKQTVLFYVHYDGQPVVRENWNTDPYEPVIKAGYEARGGEVVPFETIDFPIDPELRIFARSASDDKAPIIGLLTAIDALRASDMPPSINMKFFFEGEEERGSPHLEKLLAEHGDLLDADVMMFLDGPVHQSGRKKLSFGVRGPVGFDVTVYGPDRPLHSGHYGNFAPNPINMLAHLLTSMRDEDGRVLIDGFYDEVVPPNQVQIDAIAQLPKINAQLKEELALGRNESPGMRYQEAILWPALNLKGIRAGEVGKDTRNTIVPTATASVGYRMVPNQTPQRLKELTRAHLKDQGYHVVSEEPDAKTRHTYQKVAKLTWTDYGYGPVRTLIEAPASQALIGTMKDLSYSDLILIPSSGGSLPIWYFEQALDFPIVMLPIANYDNNQHAENENIRIRNLWEGIEIYASIMADYGNRLKAESGR